MLIPITFTEEPAAYVERDADFVEATQEARTADVEIYAVGDVSAEEAFGKILEEDLSKEVSVGLQSWGRIITDVALIMVSIAALIMVSIFAAFAGAQLVGARRWASDSGSRSGLPPRRSGRSSSHPQ